MLLSTDSLYFLFLVPPLLIASEQDLSVKVPPVEVSESGVSREPCTNAVKSGTMLVKSGLQLTLKREF